ncbi:MAG TPA: DUF2267 domain-containing protein [Xanthobacteraceae bacterium]|nr:DUF2267 domain-containing protein [Xanthobacteraceae bacterium]
MRTDGLESIDHTVQLTHNWINELDERLGWNDRAQSYRLLRNVLHALRDCLQVNEAADFAAQLPSLLRGVYYEQWRPSTVPVKRRGQQEFIARINHGPAGNPIFFTPEFVSIVFRFLSTKIEAGEIEDVRHALPADLRALWPATPQAA